MSSVVGSVSRRADLRWWAAAANGREPHDAVNDIVVRLRRKQAYRRSAYLHFARSYGGADLDGLSASSYATRAKGWRPSTLAFNVIASACNTVQAKISKNRPLPMFLTSGGDWGQQRKAKQLSKFVEGEFYRCDVYENDPLIVLDACVLGDGIVKIYRDDERIFVEREFPWRVFGDESEAQYGKPRSIYQRKPVDRLVLQEKYPEARDKLEFAENNEHEDEWGYDTLSDQLVVTEAWHLRSGKGANDGRHVVCVQGVTLIDEPYERDYFPFAVLRRNAPQMGIHGQGFAEELDGIQYEINFTARRVQESHRRMGGSHWAVEAGAKVSVETLNNGIATILRYSGTPPQAVQQQPVHPDTYAYVMSLIPKAYEMSGVSQMSASSALPRGLNGASGTALETYNDAETERFVVFAKAFEDFHLEIARQMIDLARELAEINPAYAVQTRSKRFVKSVTFKDVDLPEDAYVMQAFPTSMLSKTPTGRLQQVQDLAKAGWITPSQAKRLIDLPDLERMNDLENAAHELVEELIERMLDDNYYEEPEQYMGPGGLVDALHTTSMAYLRAKIDRAPEDRLRLLRQFMDACKALLDEQAPANDNSGPSAPGAPGPGMPPPAPLPATGMYGPGAGAPPLPMTGTG